MASATLNGTHDPETKPKPKAKPPSKHATGKPFTVEVCDAIRHHIGSRKALESKRKAAFEDRDAAIAELGELSNKESPEATKAKARHSDAVIQIEDLNDRIKWHRNQIDELVDNADEPGFDFLYEPEDEPETKVTKGKNDKPGKSGPTKPEADAGVFEGVDQQLAASVNELDMRENLKGLLINAGLTTIGAVVKEIDDPKQSLEDIKGIGENTAAEIVKAVKAYRKKHRDASRKVEGAAA
jgi:hypothetical protein